MCVCTDLYTPNGIYNNGVPVILCTQIGCTIILILCTLYNVLNRVNRIHVTVSLCTDFKSAYRYNILVWLLCTCLNRVYSHNVSVYPSLNGIYTVMMYWCGSQCTHLIMGYTMVCPVFYSLSHSGYLHPPLPDQLYTVLCLNESNQIYQNRNGIKIDYFICDQ